MPKSFITAFLIGTIYVSCAIVGCKPTEQNGTLVELNQEVLSERVPVGIFFSDTTSTTAGSVLVDGKEIDITSSLEMLFKRLSELRPNIIVIHTGKSPPLDLAAKISAIRNFCESEGIGLDISADELFLSVEKLLIFRERISSKV